MIILKETEDRLQYKCKDTNEPWKQKISKETIKEPSSKEKISDSFKFSFLETNQR